MDVVIIDDSEALRQRVITLISELPFINIAGEAENSLVGLDVIRKVKPALAIIDIKIPGVNGIEVMKKVKEEFPSIKVIMLTNYPYPQYKNVALEGGADYFLNKSDEFEKLPEIIKTINNGFSWKIRNNQTIIN